MPLYTVVCRAAVAATACLPWAPIRVEPGISLHMRGTTALRCSARKSVCHCMLCPAGRIGGYGLSLYGIELRPGATIVDVGSNIGNFAMWALVTLKVGCRTVRRTPVVGCCTLEAATGHVCNPYIM